MKNFTEKKISALSFWFRAAFVLLLFFTFAATPEAAYADRETFQEFKFKLFAEICKKGSPEEIRDAVKSIADINESGNDGNYDIGTPLMFAARYNNNPEATKMLLQAGADVNVADEFGRTPLMYAAWYNNNPEVAKVLIQAGADVNVADKFGQTPLMFAVDRDVAKALLQVGADVNAADEDGWTPLMYAADQNNLEIAKALLKAGADVNAADKDGKTPLTLAAEYRNSEITEILLQAGTTRQIPAFRAADLHLIRLAAANDDAFFAKAFAAGFIDLTSDSKNTRTLEERQRCLFKNKPTGFISTTTER